MTHTIALIHEENGVFGVSFPDFPGCISTADTLDDCIRRGQQALTLHVAGMEEDGDAMPVLRTAAQMRADRSLAEDLVGATLVAVPVILPGKAVRINITLEENLLAAVDRTAKATGSTRSGFLADAARAKLGG